MSLKSATYDKLPLVFIHGSYANSNSWKKIIENLGERYETFAVNLPGHGGVEDPDDFDAPDLTPEFEQLTDLLDGKINDEAGIHLIGHSYGGVVALAAAMTNILPVKKLTLFETVDISVLPVFKEFEAMKIVNTFVDRYKYAFQHDEKYACARVIDFWGGDDAFAMIPSHIQDQMATMTKNNIRHWDLIKNNSKPVAAYQSLDIPVTLVYGSHSNMVAKRISNSLNDNLPNSSLHEIQGASHFMITSHASDCAHILAAK